MKYKTIIEFESNKDVVIKRADEVLDFLDKYTDIDHDCLCVLMVTDTCELATLHILDSDYFNPELSGRLFSLSGIETCKDLIITYFSNTRELKANVRDAEIVQKIITDSLKHEVNILDFVLISKFEYFSYADNCVGSLMKEVDKPYL